MDFFVGKKSLLAELERSEEKIRDLQSQLVRESISKKSAEQKSLEFEEKNHQLSKQVLRLEQKVEGQLSHIFQLGVENRNLRQKLESIPTKKPNSRGAGRKKSVSKDEIFMVQSLLRKGNKVAEIVRILNEDTKQVWTHSKVTYIKEKYL
ncbi:MAG: hypothetical protein R3Y07_01070 [Eubacteriales bacterium]